MASGSQTPQELKGRLNRLLIFSESLINTIVMDPVQSRFEKKHSQEELQSIDELTKELSNSDLFWKVLKRKFTVPSRTFQIFRIAAILYYVKSASDLDLRIQSLQQVQLLLEKKLPIEDEMIREFLILCVDLRTIILACRLGLPLHSFEESERDFFAPFPTDGYVNLDQEAKDFFQEQLDSNNKSIQEGIRADSLNVDVLIDAFEQDLFFLLANLMVDLNQQESKNIETNRRVSAALRLSPMKTIPFLSSQASQTVTRVPETTVQELDYDFAPDVDYDGPTVPVSKPIRILQTNSHPLDVPTVPSLGELTRGTSKKIKLERNGQEKAVPPNIRRMAILSYPVRPSTLTPRPSDWASLEKPKLALLNFEHRRRMMEFKQSVVPEPVQETPRVRQRYTFQSLEAYDTPL